MDSASSLSLCMALILISGTNAKLHKFNVTCDVEQGRCLEIVAIEVKDQLEADVWIDINTPNLELDGNISFTNLNSLTINSELNQTINCTSSKNAGIIISGIVDTLTISHVNMTFCGLQISSPLFEKGRLFRSALIIDLCRYVHLNQLAIDKSRGIGLTILKSRRHN